MVFSLYKINTLISWIFISGHLTETTIRGLTCYSTRTYYLDSEPTSLRSKCCVLSGEATKRNSIVFGLTRPGLEPMIYHNKGEHAYHYITVIFFYKMLIMMFELDLTSTLSYILIVLVQWVPLGEQELITLLGDPSSPLVLSGISVVRSLVFCVHSAL